MAYIKNEFWFTDSEGRRIGYIWPEDMASILEGYYGTRRWVQGFINDFGYSRSQVERWADGRAPIPKDVAHLINLLGILRMKSIPLPPITPNHPAHCTCSICTHAREAASAAVIAEKGDKLTILTGNKGKNTLKKPDGPKPETVAQRKRKQSKLPIPPVPMT